MARAERFPMADGPSVDWKTAEDIYDMYKDIFNGEVTLDEIADSGGFRYSDVCNIPMPFMDEFIKRYLYQRYVNKF